MNENKGIMPTKVELTLEQSQQGVTDDVLDWFKKVERPPTPAPKWNKGRSAENKPTQKWLSDLEKAEVPSRTFDDLMSTPINFSAFVMNRLQISELAQDILVGPAYNILKDWNNPKGDRYPFDLSKPLPLVMSGNYQIIPVDYFFNNDLAYLQGGSTGRTYTTSLTKIKATKYNLLGIEDMVPNLESKHDVYSTKIILAVTNVKVKEWYGYGHLEEIKTLKPQSYQKKLNISRLMTHKAGITDLKPYSADSNPQGFIYVDKLGRNRLMCSHKLYKFNDGTLISLCDTLKDMANNLEMCYTSVMPRRRWSSLDKKRSRIMIKDIDRQLLDRRLMRSLERFVGGRDTGKTFDCFNGQYDSVISCSTL
ncbi:hypothetical protein Tco_0156927 [Tanacetum coccineum]